VTLSAASAQTVTVDYATSGGGSFCNLSPADPPYVGQAGTLQFVPGDTSETISITTCVASSTSLPVTFTVALTNPTAATLADSEGQGTIIEPPLN
jgi:hypothetical protein